jgi:SOS-response transcriptional repressor LexA
MDNKLTQLKQFFNNNRRLPTFEEMTMLFTLKSKSHVSAIVDMFIDRGILVKESGKLSLGVHFFDIPILGSIVAGVPMAEEQSNRGFVSVNNMHDPEHTYALVVKGDSMIMAGIMEGDVVIVNSKREARFGDIIAAFIDHEWTLKYYMKSHKGIYLKAANDNFKDIYPKDQLTMGGVVEQVVRKYIH